MIKRTHAEWRALFNEHKQSGLTAATFCRQKKLCPRYFSLRRRQLTGKPGFDKAKPAATPFVQARLQPRAQPTDGIVLQRGDYQLILPVSVSPEWLATLIKALA